MNESTPFVCPDHGKICLVTLPNRARAMRVRCNIGERGVPCVDRYFLMPSCTVNGHSGKFRVVRFSKAVEVVAHCSGCGHEHILPQVDANGIEPIPMGV
ncbi:hypothetical protein HY477_02715 [Candidatus Uhrbacteria bacterium]|nr:hypothetical protein [Candidatus Uhrbacteria bacterium]